jgi:hypothetical protein
MPSLLIETNRLLSSQGMAESRTEQPAFDWRQMTPGDSPKGLPDVMADPLITGLRTPKIAVGDPTYDFELPVYDFTSGTKAATGQIMHLADIARTNPVALIFGSYT